jgi:upstream activation factor subunit UAF30
MAKGVKKSSSSVESQMVPAPVPVVESVDQVVSEVSVAPVVPKVAKTKRVKAPATPAPVEVQVDVASSSTSMEPVVENVVLSTEEEVVENETPVTEQTMAFLSKLHQVSSLISSLKGEFRHLEKKWVRELKVASRANLRRRKKTVNRAPSGFVKPTRISDELAKFLGKDVGSEMARTEVTRDINKYIRTHNLQDSTNGRKINPDTKLASLLKIKKGDELTYFNLQRYMSPHFSKNVKVEAGVPVVSDA